MLEGFNETLVHVIETNVWLAPFAALLGGLLTAANPCVIAMVPLMTAYVAGQTENRGIGRSLLLSSAFTLGLTTTFAFLFLVSVAATSFLNPLWWKYITAAVCLLMGLHLMGVLNFTIPAAHRVSLRRVEGWLARCSSACCLASFLCHVRVLSWRCCYLS